jgi:hypothetical protein
LHTSWRALAILLLGLIAFFLTKGMPSDGAPLETMSKEPNGSLHEARLIQTEALAATLKASEHPPAIVCIGFRWPFESADIPNAQHIGPASDNEALKRLRAELLRLGNDKSVVLYCGCCPWEHCPNITPAVKLIEALGLKNARILYLPQGFEKDWIEKGYPTKTKGGGSA